MAVPTITVVSPNSGPVAGSTLVQIMGGGFQLSPAPPLSGKVPTPNPSVEVLFGSSLATRVAVTSTARILALVPVSPLPDSAPAGAVDVTVRNVDQSGNVIPGESVTVVGAYTYALPNFNRVPEYELTRLVRTLIRAFRKQVLPSGVYHTVNTDYSTDPASGMTALAELPAVIISGPALRENRFHSLNRPRVSGDPFGLGEKYFGKLRTPYTVDLTFGVAGVTDNVMQSINLMSEIVGFFNRNKFLAMQKDVADAALGNVTYEMDWVEGAQPKAVSMPNDSNIRAFRGSFVVRGFDIEDASMTVAVTRQLEDQLAGGSVLEPSAVVINTEQTGVSYAVGPSPGPPQQESS